MTASTRSTAAPAALARNRLGVPQVIYFALSGVLVLAAATSIAVIVFFARDRQGESLWPAVIAPVLSAAALVVMVWLVVDNYATLLGVAPARRWPGSSPPFSPSPRRQA